MALDRLIMENANNTSNTSNTDKLKALEAARVNESGVTMVPSKPEASNATINLDEVNKMTRTTVEKVQFNPDNTDSRNKKRSPKPPNYAAKKTVAQGMMDIALITSNANQLKNLVEYQSTSRTYYFSMTLIIVSLVLQVTVGVVLIFKGRFDSKSKDKAAAARVNNWVMSAVFLITIINVFIAVFSTSSMIGSVPAVPVNNTA